MPKKRTYEQLERALKRAKRERARTKRAYDSSIVGEAERAKGWRDTISQLKDRHRRESAAQGDRDADRVLEVEGANAYLKNKLQGETFRADILGKQSEELNDKLLRDALQYQSEKAVDAEVNLIHCRRALEASNTVSLGLLDALKRVCSPTVFNQSGLWSKNPDLGDIKPGVMPIGDPH